MLYRELYGPNMSSNNVTNRINIDWSSYSFVPYKLFIKCVIFTGCPTWDESELID